MSSSKPLFVLPCSADKASVPAKAIELYQGKGYLPLVKNSIATLGIDYNLAILSAKYGLIHALDVIDPYEKKLVYADLPAFIHQHSRRANALVSACDPSKIIACLPKFYLHAFTSMLSNAHRDIAILTPPAGGGIGIQRGFLANQLALLESSCL